MTGHSVYHHRIPEHYIPGKRLGRHVQHDSRSLAYPWRASGQQLQSRVITRHTGLLDQGSVGSCTGNAETGALGCDPLYAPLADRPAGVVLDESTAVGLYSAAEVIDGDGPYPPNDNGSSGLSVCQAARNEGLISGYVHCLSLTDVLDTLSSARPVILGVSWYDSFDQPDSSGLVTISPAAQVRGGHEFLARILDVEKRIVGCDNSWGMSWGIGGSFGIGWDTLERLLAEEGDGTVSYSISETPPPPVPQPQPAYGA